MVNTNTNIKIQNKKVFIKLKNPETEELEFAEIKRAKKYVDGTIKYVASWDEESGNSDFVYKQELIEEAKLSKEEIDNLNSMIKIEII